MTPVVVRWRGGSLEQTTTAASGSGFGMGMSLVMTRIVPLTSFLFEINHDKSERKNASCTSINQEAKKRKLKQKNKRDK